MKQELKLKQKTYGVEQELLLYFEEDGEDKLLLIDIADEHGNRDFIRIHSDNISKILNWFAEMELYHL